MTIRGAVAFLGLLLICAGLGQIIFPEQALVLTEALAVSLSIRLSAVLGFIIGLVLLAAAIRQIVGLRLIIFCLGLIAIGLSVLAFLNPGLIRDVTYAAFLHRHHAFQLFMLWVTGLMRIALGCVFLFAMARSPRPQAATQPK